MEVTTENNVKETVENGAPTIEAVQEKIPTPPEPHHQKKSKKEERSKKDDKAVEQFLKSLNSIQNPEEKFSAVCKKFSETADENRRLNSYIKQTDKKFAVIFKEKEQLQLELNRTILVKSKLENLCRELQKQNKSIKDESLLKIHEEEERRKETQAKFQSTLSEITALLQQNNEKNAKLRDDNISMTKKFKCVVEQYELREQQVDKMAKQMSLESQLSEAKLTKASLEAQAEKERLIAEMAQLKLELGQSRAKIMELLGTEKALRSQIDMYTDKYDEFQNALVKSNQVFGGFKGEMEKMSKKIVKLEKESLSWKKRWETSQTALLDMCGDKQALDERMGATERQLAQMQRLCRTLQGERTTLLNTLKEHNIERPPMPALPPMPAIPTAPAPPSKVDAMAANCAQLKQSLAQLQSQLNVLTTKNGQQNPEEPQPPTTKSKKGKGKKSKECIVPKSVSQENASNENRIIEILEKAVADSTTNLDKSERNSMEKSLSPELRLEAKESAIEADSTDTKQEIGIIEVAKEIATLALDVTQENNANLPVTKEIDSAVEDSNEVVKETVNLESANVNDDLKKPTEVTKNAASNVQVTKEETAHLEVTKEDLKETVTNSTVTNETENMLKVKNETGSVSNVTNEAEIVSNVTNETGDVLNVTNETENKLSESQDSILEDASTNDEISQILEVKSVLESSQSS